MLKTLSLIVLLALVRSTDLKFGSITLPPLSTLLKIKPQCGDLLLEEQLYDWNLLLINKERLIKDIEIFKQLKGQISALDSSFQGFLQLRKEQQFSLDQLAVKSEGNYKKWRDASTAALNEQIGLLDDAYGVKQTKEICSNILAILDHNIQERSEIIIETEKTSTDQLSELIAQTLIYYDECPTSENKQSTKHTKQGSMQVFSLLTGQELIDESKVVVFVSQDINI